MIRAKGRNARIVLVTCPSLVLARKIARAVVEQRLAACVNVVRSPVESLYTWKGKLESAREHLLLIKTTAQRLSPLEREVKRLHTYAVPEFIALPVTDGSQAYLAWLREATATHSGESSSGQPQNATANRRERVEQAASDKLA
jgi:periplasmic divalent cation tolerance protein